MANAEDASAKVFSKIVSGKLQTTDPSITWGDLEYEDGTFDTIGGVEEE